MQLGRRMRKMRLSVIALALSAMAQVSHAWVLERVAATGALRVCIWPEYFGISYRNPRTNTLHGLDIELSRALADELGATPEYVETDFIRLFADLAGRRCDIAMMAVGVTPERARVADFSRPYLRSDVYAIASRANRAIKSWADIDQPGRVVVVQKGTFMEPLMRRTLVRASLLGVSRPAEREREVESGRADVFITDYPYSQRLLANADWARIIAPDQPVQPTDYAYALPKGDPAWLERVDRFVSRIKQDGRLAVVAGRHNLLPIVVRD